eukprot:scaffold54863_cov31-Tisochrysis_lutea.AAC.4
MCATASHECPIWCAPAGAGLWLEAAPAARASQCADAAHPAESLSLLEGGIDRMATTWAQRSSRSSLLARRVGRAGGGATRWRGERVEARTVPRRRLGPRARPLRAESRDIHTRYFKRWQGCLFYPGGLTN